MSDKSQTQSKSKTILGILETGIVAEPLLSTFGSYPDMFAALFHPENPELILRSYNVIEGQYPADIDECDAYLITGSKSDSYSNEDWVVQLRHYVTTLAAQRKKLIGICFGHQLIAHALGGLAAKSNKGWGVGVYSSKLVENLNLSWLKANEAPEFKLLVSHQDQIITLPTGATLLASNEFCPIAAYTIDNHILCFQGHPEFSKAYSKGLIEARKAIIPEEVSHQGITSLSQTTDHQQIAKWILKFIASRSE
ncbi:MAG: GMP synthase-like glutamine amidotransferase [Phenylobacterium sp.]|jgi:GMP synthase-like glutamine amidotransferase